MKYITENTKHRVNHRQRFEYYEQLDALTITCDHGTNRPPGPRARVPKYLCCLSMLLVLSLDVTLTTTFWTAHSGPKVSVEHRAKRPVRRPRLAERLAVRARACRRVRHSFMCGRLQFIKRETKPVPETSLHDKKIDGCPAKPPQRRSFTAERPGVFTGA